MGYYIEANMSFTGATDEEVDLITSYIEENEDDFYLIYPNGESKTEGKWMHPKLYIDFGGFPGKDRLPREAVMHDCCIITGKAINES